MSTAKAQIYAHVPVLFKNILNFRQNYTRAFATFGFEFQNGMKTTNTSKSHLSFNIILTTY